MSGALRRADLAFAAAAAAILALHLVLFIGHAMWRDEMQAWMIAAASATPLDLWRAMRNEGHPALWHALLWIASCIWNDPRAMRALHLAIGLGLFAVVLARTPFTRLERLLLCAGYYLMFEYTVIARAYGLGMLLILLAVDAHGRGRSGPWKWLWLGLAANTSAFGTILAFVFAARFAWDVRRDWRSLLPGAAILAGLAALAVVWMAPAADTVFGEPPRLRLDALSLSAVLQRLASVFLPVGVTPGTWDPSPFAALTPGPRGTAAIAVPVLAVTLLALPGRAARISFALAVAAIAAFIDAYPILSSARHVGAAFVAFVGFLWLARLRPQVEGGTGRLAATCSMIVLLAGAAGGAQIAAQALALPFSRGGDAAAFLRASQLDRGLIIGVPSAHASLVAGLLGRPIYYPACDCTGTFVRWNVQRLVSGDLSAASPAWPRILARLAAEPGRTGVLLASRPLPREDSARAFPGLAVTERAAFPEALAEQFYVYELTLRETR